MKKECIYLIIAMLSLSQSFVEAQEPGRGSTPRHNRRFLGVANFAFVDSKTLNSTVGGLFQVSAMKTRVVKMAKDSVLFTLDRQLEQHLQEGPIASEIRRALEGEFLPLSSDATVVRTDSIWQIRSGRELYGLASKEDRLSVSSFVFSEVIHQPKWYLHFMATGGIRGTSDYVLFGNIGLMRRNDSPTFTIIGLGIQGTLPVNGIGPVLRVELLDVIGVQAGLIFLQDSQMGVLVSIDFMGGLLRDLGLL